MSGGGGNAEQQQDDQEGQGDRKVAARPSNPSGPTRTEERLGSFLQDTQIGERLTEEEVVSARAEVAASSHPSESSLQLDSIWSRDLGSIDLPEYTKAHNTISFPEKVSLL